MRILLVAAGLAFAIGALEVGLRVLYPNPKILVADERLGLRPQPNLDVLKTFGGHERVVRISTNSRGLRGPEIAGEPRPGARRILALGDSFTLGHAVTYEEAWPAQLERALGERAAVEVVNAGVSGYGTGQQLLLYRELAPVVRPDAVVLAFAVVNDVLDNLCIDENRLGRRTDIPCFAQDGDGLRVTSPTRRAPMVQTAGISTRLRVMDFFVAQAKRVTIWNPALLGLGRRVGMQVELPYVPETIVAWYDTRFSEPGWALTRRLLLELRNELAARRVPLVVLIVPSSLQVDAGRRGVLEALGRERPLVRAYLEEPDRPQRLIAEFCAEVGLLCVDPLRTLRENEPVARSYYPIDGHWTPAAHQVAARLVADRLAGSGALR
jgi:hypothetical protein